ncbi:MAG: DUF1614 domain-containing protein [Syntrophales bacterium]|nr:DUF1614 domain-containing protein [Syntrophales bacterium]
MIFNPLTFLFMAILFFVLGFFLLLIQIDIVALVFERIGIPPQYIFIALLSCLVGSSVNIPLKKIPQEDMTTERTVRFYGLRYVIPPSKSMETILAINVGGAIVPIIISVYLLFKTGMVFQSLLATVFLTIVTHRLARPVKGVGIALPFFISPLMAALSSLIIDPGHAPIIAYISGTLGTLIGADILNLKKIVSLGAPVVSIGGAGTFDGIFLSGILAVMLSAILV